MDIDPLILSRVQFAFVVSFHVLFPSFTIGLASWLAVLEGLYLKTRRETYARLYRLWVRVFAVSFGMGVVSGIVMSYQFGTNWSGLTTAGGSILGPVLSYEVVTAFFLEATFLGVMLFGWNKVPPKLHFAATCMVAIGTVVSTFWIISANSWMQTPAGYAVTESGALVPDDWMEIIFNPSFVERLAHKVLAAYLTTGFFIGAIGAFYLLRKRAQEEGRVMLKMAIGLVIVVAPAQIVVGDLVGLMVHEHQPAKLAAMEGHWETVEGAPLILFALPDAAAEANRFEVGIPNLGSLILTHDWDGEIQGLKAFAPDERPPVWPVFWSFRIMVALGFWMLAMGVVGAVLWARKRLTTAGWFHRLMLISAPSGFIAVLTGWFTAEIGRQPWIVQGILRTEDALSPVTGTGVVISLVLFVLVYAIVFGAGAFYIAKLIRHGPEIEDQEPAHLESGGRPKRPLSFPQESFGGDD
jgi:cytochrome d ubiquinol oxidase subunit I